ncbi:hypothetical protein GCM10027612_61670 [Microbispora bryophytorum subsp. camponoti]
MLLRLRIALPDRPGSLSQVTGILGSAGADITQVTVLDRGDGRALDDFTVYWPDAAPARTSSGSCTTWTRSGSWASGAPGKPPAPIRSWRS